MSNYQPQITTSNGGPDDWAEGYDTSSSSGLVCLLCHAMVPRMANHAAGHRAWHTSQPT